MRNRPLSPTEDFSMHLFYGGRQCVSNRRYIRSAVDQLPLAMSMVSSGVA